MSDDRLVLQRVLAEACAFLDGLPDRPVRASADAEAVAAAFAVSYGLNAATALAFLPLGVRTAATAGLMSGNRNMALYLAILPAAADPRIGLFFGLCQFPLFLSPFLLRPLYQRLLRRRHARPADGQSHR